MVEIKNLKKAASRIKKAIKNKENIILYSDADLDGTTSLIILEETIKSLGGKISALYFPDRDKEGYGLNEKALLGLKKYTPALLIVSDCGISNLKEVEIANKIGFEVIIIEHHEISNHIPKAAIFVDPKQKGDKYPFKFLAACGICFKLSKIILKNKPLKNLEQSFLELVALGTIADMMPQTDDNKIFIEKGLSTLQNSFRPGIRAFFKFFNPQEFSVKELASKIISALQITDTKNHLTESYLVLTAKSEKNAQNLIKKLLEKNAERRETIQSFFQEIKEKFTGNSSPIIFEGSSEVPLSITGTLASRIHNYFKKPTFIYNLKKNLVKGSARTPKNVNSVRALENCSFLLEVYGGHPPASGFTLKSKNLEKFKNCLIKYFSSQ